MPRHFDCTARYHHQSESNKRQPYRSRSSSRAPEPALDPPAVCSVFHGLLVEIADDLAHWQAPDICAAKLELYDRYLLVEDNGRCGGVNVSFGGLYVRAESK
jgi:hypothetical protein